MGMRYIFKRDRAAEYRQFVLQKQLVEKHFPFFRCALRRNVLECVGEIVPSVHCCPYQIGIRYQYESIPQVRIRRPEIRQRVHMYRDGTLCLYDHREKPWSPRDNIHEKIIPWTAEWLVFYELQLLSGKWWGPEASHGDAELQLERTCKRR